VIALALFLATANAESLRATLALEDDGAVRVVRAERVDDEVPNLPGDLAVLGPDGAVLATAALPPFATTRDIPFPEGGGAAGYAPTRFLRVTMPWPEGATDLSVRGQRTRPFTAARMAPAPSDAEAVLANGPSARRLDLVFLGDGFTPDDRPKFDARVDAIVDHLLTLEPYTEYSGLINVWKVFAPSTSSGVDEEFATNTHVTPFECAYFCDPAIERLICCDEAKVVDFVDAQAPFADGIMVLVNSDKYGGAGGFTYGTSYTGDTQFVQVAAHELGHSLFGLWDEYTYVGQTGASDAYVSPNCTHHNVATNWPEWVGESVTSADPANPGGADTVDRYEGCSFEDWDRPTADSCMMNTLQDQYCPVCRQEIITRLYGALGGEMIVSQSPDPGARVVLAQGESQTFKLKALGPEQGVDVVWSIDGEEVGTGPELVVDGCDDLDGELVATVSDPTSWVRSDPQSVLLDSVAWTVKTKCDGCGCATQRAPSAAWLGALGLLAWRRRKT
jgi:MYXO-CTERM domain-containing protein